MSGVGAVFVPGRPVPQGSMQSFAYVPKGGGRPRSIVTSDNKQTMPWRDSIAVHVSVIIGDRIVYPIGPVALRLLFVMPRRAAEPKRVTPPHVRKPDGDKLCRAVCDALKGLIYTDDAQVTDLAYRKRTAELGEQPGLHLEWTVPAATPATTPRIAYSIRPYPPSPTEEGPAHGETCDDAAHG